MLEKEESMGTVVEDSLAKIVASPVLNEGIKAMKPRAAEFASKKAMNLVGAVMYADSRKQLCDDLEAEWVRAKRRVIPSTAAEVVIGAGFHAAVYCAARVAKGFPKPVVIGDVPGGAFAMSKAPSFWLNSRNRPGLLGMPGKQQALNYLPGAPIQPADISAGEYSTNADIALVVQLTLAEYADYYPGTVKSVTAASNGVALNELKVVLKSGETIRAGRVIDARGVGSPPSADGKRILNFPQLMAKVDTPFPLQGMERVAVIGGRFNKGDGARGAIEALLGMAPSAGMTTAGMDWVRAIDWYGKQLPKDCIEWRNTQRGRYQNLGSYIGKRLTIRNVNTNVGAQPSMGSVVVSGETYSHAILATGWTETVPFLGEANQLEEFKVAGTRVARKGNAEYYRVGPAANLPFSGSEATGLVGTIPQNQVAMFRLANRTAALATSLPAPPKPKALPRVTYTYGAGPFS